MNKRTLKVSCKSVFKSDNIQETFTLLWAEVISTELMEWGLENKTDLVYNKDVQSYFSREQEGGNNL